MLDASIADLVLGPIGGGGEYVQTGSAEPAAQNLEALESENVQLMINPTVVSENGIVLLSGQLQGVEPEGPLQASIDWGDGSSAALVPVNLDTLSFDATHRYLDDDPSGTPSDLNTICVTIFEGGEVLATRSTEVTVNNIAPFNLVLVPTRATIFENQTAELTLEFVDPGSLDTHHIQVDWADGTPIESFELTSGERELTLTHLYLDDDPTATLQDTYLVRVTVTDDDGGQRVVTTPVRVLNVPPTIHAPGEIVINEGELLDLSDGRLVSFSDMGPRDTYTATIDWGDGSPVVQIPANAIDGSGTFDASHTYADDGRYVVTLRLNDDDFGQALRRFEVQVNNVAPGLAGIDPPPSVNEGQAFTLTELGVKISDPGFDNPLNPFVPGGSQETFAAMTVDWGDGTPAEMVSVVNRISGGPGVPTTAELDHAPHTYADNGTYTVKLTIADDDGGLVERTFQIEVKNVAPTLVLTDRIIEIKESETVDLFDLGTFSDPGFDNALNPLVAGGSQETFTYTITWDDPTLPGLVENGIPSSRVNGGVGVDTTGTLADSHLYRDNNADNLHTITVTLTDDDGGSTTEQIVVRVLNVDPSLQPITATDLNTKGETFLTLEFDDPGTEELTVWVDWGDKLSLPPQDRFVPEIVVLGPGTQHVTLLHMYTGPPDPLSPASDIIISVFIRDDDFGQPLVVDPGQSNTEMVAISNPGEGVNPVRIDTTPQVPRLVFPQTDEAVFLPENTSAGQGSLQTTDLRTAVGDTKAVADRYFELRVIDPATGQESEGYRLKAEAIDDLPGLFRTLPDGHYKIYLVRTETNTRRLVIEVYVRNGKLIDPGDDSEGTRDRPPTDEVTQPPVEDKPDDPQDPGQTSVRAPQASTHPTGELLALATPLVGLAATESGRRWAERIDRALAAAKASDWQKLRRRYPHKPKNT